MVERIIFRPLECFSSLLDLGWEGRHVTPPSSPSSLPRTALLTPLRTEDQPTRSPTARKEYSAQSFSQLRQMPDGSPVVFRGRAQREEGWFPTLSQRCHEVDCVRKHSRRQSNPLSAGAIFLTSRSLNQCIERMQTFPQIRALNREDHV